MVGAHEKTGNFKCPQCGVVFETLSNHTKHLQVAHGIKRPINCKKCDLYFDGNQSYRKHTKNCSYKCLQCSKTFETKFNLDRHVPRAHHKKVRCDRCRKEFDGRHSYQTHNKECFYRCDRCKYVHKTEAAMAVHKRTHITEDRKAKEYTERIVVVYK